MHNFKKDLNKVVKKKTKKKVLHMSNLAWAISTRLVVQHEHGLIPYRLSRELMIFINERTRPHPFMSQPGPIRPISQLNSRPVLILENRLRGATQLR